MTYDEFVLPTKKEIKELRPLNFGDMTSQASYGDELNREFTNPKDRFLSCLKCRSQKDLIDKTQEIADKFKDEFMDELKNFGSGKSTYIAETKSEKLYEKNINSLIKLTHNNPKQKIIDLAFQPVFDIKDGSICVEVVITEKEEERTVIGLVFFHNDKYCFICTSCWNALITQQKVKDAFSGEKLHFVKESIPSENLIFKSLPLVLEEVEK